MNIVRLSGGIGNQLFQFSLYMAIKSAGIDVKMHYDKADIDKHSFNAHINLKPMKLSINYASISEIEKFQVQYGNDFFLKLIIKLKMIIGLKVLKYFISTPLYFHQGRFNLYRPYWVYFDNTYFDGTYVNKNLAAQSIDFFRQKIDYLNYTEEFNTILKKIHDRNTVSIHFRRGDYSLLSNQGFFTLKNGYYQKALNIIKNKVKNPLFIIFGHVEIDEIDNLQINDFIIVSLRDENKDLMELILMSKCTNNIIANSTFSLWASYINSNDNKIIIGPSKWMKQYYATTRNILPDGAITIKV